MAYQVIMHSENCVDWGKFITLDKKLDNLECTFYDYNITEPLKEPSEYFWPKILGLITCNQNLTTMYEAKTRPTKGQLISEWLFDVLNFSKI